MVCWKKTSAVTVAILLICVSSAASAGAPDPASVLSSNRHSADVILTGGHILTEDSHDSVVEALAIRDGRLGDALKSYTVWAAHQLFLEADAGSLEPGKSADIAVWAEDPLTAPTAALENLECELTLFRGTVVYQAAAIPITITNAKHHATK